MSSNRKLRKKQRSVAHRLRHQARKTQAKAKRARKNGNGNPADDLH